MTVYSGDATNIAMADGDSISTTGRIVRTDGLWPAVDVAANATVRIAGLVDGQVAILARQSSNVTITASGTVSGIGGGIHCSFDNITLLNYGSVETYPTGGPAVLASRANATIINAGIITGSSCVLSTNSLANVLLTVNNRGTMIGGTGIYSTKNNLVIENTGLISTYVGINGNAVYLGDGSLDLSNFGTMIGKITVGNGADKVVNEGLIRGEVLLGGGNDIYSGAGRVIGTVSGGAGNDTLSGGIYDDVLDGGADNDVLDGGRGNDTMIGGTGHDTFHVDSIYDKVIEAVGGGNDTVYTTVSYALRAGQEIETLAVDPGADYANLAINLTGNEFANTLTGNAAANKLDGKGGADTMTGGDGSDIYYVDDAGDVVVETANHGTDTIYTSVSYALPANVEILRAQGTADVALTGNGLANTIAGNAGANRIDGGAGADKMSGGAGDDTYVVDNLRDTVVEKVDGGTDTVEASISYALRGYVENLILTGTAGIDGTGNGAANTIVGNAGANRIDGKGGLDTLTGGSGADTFVFSGKLDAAVNFATITDFEHGVDRIALDDRFFKAIGTSGVLGDQFFAISVPTTRDQHVIYDQATGLLSYDSDGSGAKAAVALAQVTPGTVLDHNDFLIV
jgi:hypothetical protein